MTINYISEGVDCLKLMKIEQNVFRDIEKQVNRLADYGFECCSVLTFDVFFNRSQTAM